MRMPIRILIVVIMVTILAAAVSADVPQLLNYQGHLADSFGVPLDTTLAITFFIYDDTLGSTILWGETHLNVEIQGGAFNVLLGSIIPLNSSILDGSLRSMALQLGSGPVSEPPMPIVSVAYAYRASFADTGTFADHAIYADTAAFALAGSGGSSYWTLSGSVLSTSDAWGIARGNAGNALLGTETESAVNFGTECTTGVAGMPTPYTTIGGGHANIATEFGATVGGGVHNAATAGGATIAGGESNHAGGLYSTVAGGVSDTAGGDMSNIAGGLMNVADGDYSNVGGGYLNAAHGAFSTVSGGGPVDTANPTTTRNRVYDNYGTISGGGGNLVGVDDLNPDNQIYGVVGGGKDNLGTGAFATVAGGSGNTAGGYGSSVAGGVYNSASGDYSTVAGGEGNSADGSKATVGGGDGNLATGTYSTVAGGLSNTGAGGVTTVSGGYQNTASGNYSAIGGGGSNAVLGDYSVVPGGYGDTITADADYSYLFGIQSVLTQDSTFMVDMPHIRFGAEATGYEFPAEDGTTGYMLTTDGSGQLGWSDGTGVGVWEVLDSIAYTRNYVGIVRGGAGNVVICDSPQTIVNLGVNCTTGTDWWNQINGITIGGGIGNHAYGSGTTIAGGRYNSAVIFGSTVAGGYHNNAEGENSFIGGGTYNFADNVHSVICGGTRNHAMGYLSSIGGGYDDTSGGWASTIGGGRNNRTVSGYTGVGSGLYNTAGEAYYDTAAVIAGGYHNAARGRFAAITGGYADTVSAPYGAIAGGRGNHIVADLGFIGGGDSNRVAGGNSVVAGGIRNTVTGWESFIGGGEDNYIAGHYAVIAGGRGDTITNTGDFSFLVGINSHLTQDSTFMVDMPHIRFGDEATGYEFPTSDGSTGQILATNGSGQLSWSAPGGSANWTITGDIIHTDDYWGLSRGGTGNLNYGDSARTMVNLGVGGVTGLDGQHYHYATVGGGWSTKARHNFATVAGGDRNSASGEHSTIGGGRANSIGADAQRATIAGGNGNIASGSSSFIGGGGANQTFGNDAVVVGGWDNDAYGYRSFLGGGSWNLANADASFIGGGQHNKALGIASVITGGINDSASGAYSTVGGGYYNHAYAGRSVVAGGERNYAGGSFSAILGGYADTITSTGNYSYLFGIRSKLTADSTFMVDMPHIRFGDETNGYEFPVADGATSQVLATDGSGQLSWVDQTGGTGTGDAGWTDDGSTVRLTTATDKVSIGVASSTAKLDVSSPSGLVVHGVHTNSGNYGQLGTVYRGVIGFSNTGMVSASERGAGVRGENTSGGYGVHGISAGSYGVYGETNATNMAAVAGRRNGMLSWGHLGSDSSGVWGYYYSKQAKLGTAEAGVWAYGDNGIGVLASAPSDSGVGVYASGGPNGYAAVFEGNILIKSPSTGLEIVELGEGLDYAEGFDVTDRESIEPGTVVSIDPENPGRLTICSEAYDSKVAGIIAGANGLGSGVRLGAGKYDYDVALAGRVYCKADATDTAIKPGDLLTTSATSGHAMKASDYDQARGAIIGKAMERLERGEKGRILVLVTLQ